MDTAEQGKMLAKSLSSINTILQIYFDFIQNVKRMKNL